LSPDYSVICPNCISLNKKRNFYKNPQQRLDSYSLDIKTATAENKLNLPNIVILTIVQFCSDPAGFQIDQEVNYFLKFYFQ
jgi:hypothetical protein